MLEQRRLALRQRQLVLRLRSAELRHDIAQQFEIATAPARQLAPVLRLVQSVASAPRWVRALGAGLTAASLVLALRHPCRALGWLGRLRTALTWWRLWQDWRAGRHAAKAAASSADGQGAPEDLTAPH